nr:uncharacterized protein LOC109165865 [Ipomoea trifida]
MKVVTCTLMMLRKLIMFQEVSQVLLDLNSHHLMSLSKSRLRGDLTAVLYNEQKVKVDAVGSNRLVVKVRCLKGEGLLVRILEAMEEMNLRVLQARVSSQLIFFAMDAILEAHQNHFSADAITQAILKSIDQKSYETHK